MELTLGYSFPRLQRAGEATAVPGKKHLSCGVGKGTNTKQIVGEKSVYSFSSPYLVSHPLTILFQSGLSK